MRKTEGANNSTMENGQLAEEVLAFWFGELDSLGLCAEARNKLWFQSSPQVDAQVRDRFGGLVEAALEGELEDWAASPGGLVALVILLDQFTRNIYRGTAAAFSGDQRALQLARNAVNRGDDARLPIIHRVFLYMPFEHSEELSDQEEGIRCFDRLLEDCEVAARDEVESFRRYMQAHRDVIAQFNRFPHRNAILGRESTPEEMAHLEKHGGF